MVLIIRYASSVNSFFSLRSIRVRLFTYQEEADVRGDQSQLAVQCLGEGSKKLEPQSVFYEELTEIRTHLCFSRFSLMTWYSNLVVQAMQLTNDG